MAAMLTAEDLARMSWAARERQQARRRHDVQLTAIDHHQRYHWQWMGTRYCYCPYEHRKANRRDA
jgi:hypothetical protein